MGFDVVYLPPIHPIGTTNRKGPNNTLTPGPDDVGSPWAIGSPDGGHDAIHPDLGTEKDFAAFVTRTKDLGMEVALDLALQATPDHPWVTSHPEWFTELADGTIAYAENPPKKYQDIYPINFDRDPDGIYAEVLRVVRKWMDLGVRIFRVDNPHTKPVAFWEWLLGEVRKTDPDVLFLAEAFTRPAMMQTLARVGFHQSYTLLHLAQREVGARGVPHRAVARRPPTSCGPTSSSTPPTSCTRTCSTAARRRSRSGPRWRRPSSPTWGVYAGFELFEHVAVRPGSEEYLDTEKFQLRPRDWAAAEAEGRSLAPYLTRLNELRRAAPRPAAAAQPALPRDRQRPDHLLLQDASRAADGQPSDTVLVVVNLDPHGARETTVRLDMPALGMEWDDTMAVHDEIGGDTYVWGQANYVRLDPFHEPAHVFRVERRGRADEVGAAPVSVDDARALHARPSATPPTASRSTTSPICPRRSATRTGTSARSSTRSWSARSRTATATAPATCSA